jgi:hypothetical protein
MFCGLLLLAAAGTPAPASADDHDKKEFGTFTLQFENDLFYGADRDYTSGLRLSWVSPPPEKTYPPLSRLREGMKLLSPSENNNTRLGLALGQEFFTPGDRYRSDLITDDRPYAGWLYLAVSVHTESATTNVEFPGMLDSVELNLGVVGPHAFAKETQDFVHDARLIDRFEGWGNQLKDEPGVLLMFERKWRGKPQKIFTKELELDFVPRVGGSIGNVLTHVNVGGAVRLGYNIPHDFGPPGLIKGIQPLDSRKLPGVWSLYGFAGAEGRVVARNIFLDGNTFANSHSVDREPLVADFSFGVACEYEKFRIAYTSVLRTPEFEGQDGYTSFGSISVSYQF